MDFHNYNVTPAYLKHCEDSSPQIFKTILNGSIEGELCQCLPILFSIIVENIYIKITKIVILPTKDHLPV